MQWISKNAEVNFIMVKFGMNTEPELASTHGSSILGWIIRKNYHKFSVFFNVVPAAHLRHDQ